MCGCCRCCRLRFEYQIRDTPKRKSIRYTGRGQEVFFFFSHFIFCFANQYNFMLHHHTICQVHCKRVLLSRPIIITLISSNNVIVRHFVQIYTSHGFTAPINLKCVCVCVSFFPSRKWAMILWQRMKRKPNSLHDSRNGKNFIDKLEHYWKLLESRTKVFFEDLRWFLVFV